MVRNIISPEKSDKVFHQVELDGVVGGVETSAWWEEVQFDPFVDRFPGNVLVEARQVLVSLVDASHSSTYPGTRRFQQQHAVAGWTVSPSLVTEVVLQFHHTPPPVLCTCTKVTFVPGEITCCDYLMSLPYEITWSYYL